MMKSVLLLATGLILNVSAAWAQLGWGKPRDVAAVKSQPLVVVLKEEDPAQLKKLAKKPEELADYQAYIAEYNAQMQELAPKLWQFSPSVEFKHEAELPALRKIKGQQRGLLQHQDFKLAHRHKMAGPPASAGGMSNHFYTSEQVSALVVDVIGNGDQHQVWRVQLAPGPVYTSDIIFSVKTLQQYLQARATGRNAGDMRAELAKNGKKLRTKTLLLDEEDITGKLTTADIKQAYSLPFEVVPRATIETAVAAGDARYACVRIMPIMEGTNAQVVTDAEDGSLLAMSMPGRVRVMGVGSSNSAIGKGNLKEFAEAAGKK